MNRVTVLVALAACGDNSGPSETGPVFTPGVALALHGVAPECALKKEGVGEQRSCEGRPGTILISIGDENRLRTIEIDLRSMTLPQARAHLIPALKPLLAAGTDVFEAELAKLDTGQRTSLAIAGATIDIVAGGTSHIAPEYSVDLRWPLADP